MKFLHKSGLLLLAVAFSCNIILSEWYNPQSWRGASPQAQASQSPISSSPYSWYNPRGYSLPTYENAINASLLGLSGALGTGAYLYGLKDPQNYAVLPIMAGLLRQMNLGNITLDDLKKLKKEDLIELLLIIAYKL